MLTLQLAALIGLLEGILAMCWKAPMPVEIFELGQMSILLGIATACALQMSREEGDAQWLPETVEPARRESLPGLKRAA
jgi:hypothetical protein